jgi:hypothetical protein
LIASLKGGRYLMVQAIKADGKPLTFTVPLGGFAVAFDGPPSEPAVIQQPPRKRLDGGEPLQPPARPWIDDMGDPVFQPKRR